jgi:hypothetical protein
MLFLIGEFKLNLIILLDRIQSSWHNRRWISDQEYYEIRRGN